MTFPSDRPGVSWAGAARIYEQCADRAARDGGVTEWFAQRHGLTTYHELVLYCWFKHHAPSDA